MRAKDILRSPLHLAGLATTASSFRDNPLIGSPYLNQRGLHVQRVKLAEAMAHRRRRSIAHLVEEKHRREFADQGYVCVPNALSDDAFAQVQAEISNTRFPAREMKQGNAVTRFITLSPETLRNLPGLSGFVRGPLFQGLLRYIASANADPLFALHTVLTQPDKGNHDPQTAFHADTFHATAKGWLFLRDVEEADGPFSYVPGSHIMTPGRLEWEQEQSLIASTHRNGLHARGSFRASAEEIAAMGYGPAVTFPVKANTFVVADTHGFHARARSSRASTRLALYGSIRRNPFSPVTGFDLYDLPGIRGRRAQLQDFAWGLAARITGKPESQPLVGEVYADDPAVR